MVSIFKNQRGDTLVEVLVATVVLTIILSGAYTVVNRATRINQSAIERTEVAGQISEQAELLVAMRSNHDGTATSTWSEIITKANSSSVSVFDCTANPTSDDAFYLSTAPDPLTIGNPLDFSRTASGALGSGTDPYPSDLFDVWIVAENSPNDTGGSDLDDQLDFHIRGCWDGIGGTNIQRSEIIYRLRE